MKINMNKLYKRFTEFLYTDVKSKNETKDLAILIRLMCLIYAFYYLTTAVAVAFFQYYFTGLVVLIAVGLLVTAFICTYENRTSIAFTTLILVQMAFPTLLTISIGYEYDFHITILFNILLLFFNKTNKMKFKRFFSFGICCYLVVLAEISDSFSRHRLGTGFPVIFIKSLNMLIMTCALVVIAYCFCTKFNQAEEKLKAINENLERMANLDTLTGLSNRRHMNDYMSTLVYDYNKTGKSFTIAIGDVDFFKKVNDTYGHDAGDYVLTKLADMFTVHMKGKGHVARWGGEEFLFAFENSDINKAYQSLDELRHQIEITPFKFKEYDFNITMTYGMEEYNDRLGTEVTINRADAKLYTGKTGGRNRVVK